MYELWKRNEEHNGTKVGVMIMEEWKDVISYEGLYRVNVYGEIYSLISKKILKPFLRGSRVDNKYIVVDLYKNKQRKTISVHRIVADAFIPNPNNLPCINHKDGNKFNNNVDNLEWCTYSDNNFHAFRTGLKEIPSGAKSKLSKLSIDDVIEIKKSLVLGDSQFGSRPLSKKYGVDHNVILSISRDKKYSDVKIPYTFFVCSDIHSAYTPWMDALSKAGFNPNKYSHKIIVCGDLFDRMDESQEVYDFATSMIEKGKLIYISGNHELLLRDCLKRGYPMSHDWHNGTAKTIIDLAPHAKDFQSACYVVQEKVKPLFDSIVNYFETEHYIFCHSCIPVNITREKMSAPKTYFEKEDWRFAHQNEWENAMWGNPFEMAEQEFLPRDKMLVFGHFHTSYAWNKYEGKPEWGDGTDFSIYHSDRYIGIDACVAYSGKVNILVIEDGKMLN